CRVSPGFDDGCGAGRTSDLKINWMTSGPSAGLCAWAVCVFDLKINWMTSGPSAVAVFASAV
ncbi:hypothetical protein, partial [Enhygromyxa salina]|uniref:hypothetical protein n=1 Tax=Enhygromyxa salina TaxID=215803 RepID=UPI001969AA64